MMCNCGKADYELDDVGRSERDMKMVFNRAFLKFIDRRDRKGNTLTPWNDVTTERLSKRLDEKWEEWKASGSSHELIDLILCATFIYLSKMNDNAKRFLADGYNPMEE